MSTTCRKCAAEYGGRMQHCPACHQTFTGESAGEKHRTGKHGVTEGPHARRCLTVAEMLDAGMAQNTRGRWKATAEGYDWEDR